MKFLCGSCRTKYQISDDKVRGKILTIRCKKCGAKVVVKESLARQANLVIAPLADEEAKAEVSAPRVALGGSAASVSGAGLASAFDVAMGGGLDDMPTSIAPTPHNEAFAGVEWYVAIDGSQIGPFAYGELIKKIQTKDVLGRHYTWHDGFDNWRRVRDVPDLSNYLPADPAAKKKPPPPPSPAPEEDAKVVDFAQKRAERDKRAAASGPSEELTAGLAENPTARATAQPAGPDPGRNREDQLDSVLDAALGIQNEGQTAKAEAKPSAAATMPAAAVIAPAIDATSPGAAALMSPAGAPSGALSDAAFATDRSSDSFLPEDLFDKVPRASAQEMVARESTRFFVAAAGVNSQKKKNRFGVAGAVSAGLAVVAFFGLWAGGVINVEIPGIGNPFARNTNWVPEPELALTDDEVKFLSKLSEGERDARVKEIKKARKAGKRVAKIDGYVQDGPAGTGATGPRGDTADGVGSVTIGSDVPSGFGKPGETQLPESGGPMIAAADGTLSNEVISRIVKENVSAVVDCSRRERSATLKGKLEFALTVEPEGAVSRVAVQTQAFRGTSIAACISERMKNWRFPSFSGAPQAIVVPFVFTSD